MSYKEVPHGNHSSSSKGQVIVPSPIRTAHQWEAGQKFEAINTGDGVLLKPAGPFQKTDIKEVASCLNYNGPTKTIEEMNEAIAQGAKGNSLLPKSFYL